jgi:hypothetical protein
VKPSRARTEARGDERFEERTLFRRGTVDTPEQKDLAPAFVDKPGQRIGEPHREVGVALSSWTNEREERISAAPQPPDQLAVMEHDERPSCTLRPRTGPAISAILGSGSFGGRPR